VKFAACHLYVDLGQRLQIFVHWRLMSRSNYVWEGHVERKIFAIILVVANWCVSPAAAQSYYEPERGTATRSALMDAIRPHVEWDLGQPIEFVVNDLRVSGDVAFASLAPQRPGGAPIDLRDTPWYRRNWDPNSDFMDFMDGTHTEALYRRMRDTWVAVHFAIGATDVWYAWDEYCPEYSSVIPEWCK